MNPSPIVYAETPAPAAAPTAPPARVAGVGLLARLQLSEPVRLYLYPVAVTVIALLVAGGLLSDAVAPLWEALAAALLGVGSVAAIERTRGAVYSPRSTARLLLEQTSARPPSDLGTPA